MAGAPAEEGGEERGRKAGSGTERGHEGDGQRGAFRNVAGGHQAAARDPRHVRLRRHRFLAAVAEGRLHAAHAADELRELRGLEGGGMVRARRRPVQGHVLFEHAGPARHRGQRDLDAERVVGETDRHLEARRERIHGAQVRVAGRGRVAAHAMEQREIAAARLTDGVHGRFHLGQIGHAGGDEEGPSLRRHVGEKRKIGDLSGGDLEGGHVERIE